MEDYLLNVLEFDFKIFTNDLKEKLDINFMLWDGDQFYLNNICESMINIIPEYTFKRGKTTKFINSIIIQTVDGKIEYELILSWKNRTGILYYLNN